MCETETEQVSASKTETENIQYLDATDQLINRPSGRPTDLNIEALTKKENIQDQVGEQNQRPSLQITADNGIAGDTKLSIIHPLVFYKLLKFSSALMFELHLIQLSIVSSFVLNLNLAWTQ